MLKRIASRVLQRAFPDPEGARMIVRLFSESFRGHISKYLVALSCMVVVAASTAGLALLMRYVVNYVFVEQSLVMMWGLAGTVLVISVAKGLADYAQSVILATIGNDIVATLQRRMFRKILKFDLDYFGERHSSKLISRLTHHANAARNALTTISTSFGRDLLTVIGLASVMVIQDPVMAVLALSIGPVVIYFVARIVRRIREISAQEFKGTASVIAATQETIHGIRVVKSFGMEASMCDRFDSAVEDVQTRSNAIVRIRSQTGPLMETLGGAAIALLVVYAGWQTITEGRTPGEFMAFITAFLLAYEPAKRLARLHVSLQKDLVAVSKMYGLLDRPEQEPDEAGETELPAVTGRVEFSNVTFSYRKGQAVINDICMVAEPGQVVALVGASGAGKSTIISLIQRFYRPSSGAILLDGVDIGSVTLKSLRRQVAVVNQDTIVFSGTIADNIRLGRPGASDQEVEAAAKAASAFEFIQALPQGFETLVSERSATLSGGQAQRISIARALLKQAPILLLDEATSALDAETERAVREALAVLRKGRTTIVVAHRLSTIMQADRIYLMEAGHIVASGSHGELLAADTRYRRLFGSDAPSEEGREGLMKEWELVL